jgi:hypothetical protein
MQETTTGGGSATADEKTPGPDRKEKNEDKKKRKKEKKKKKTPPVGRSRAARAYDDPPQDINHYLSFPLSSARKPQAKDTCRMSRP